MPGARVTVHSPLFLLCRQGVLFKSIANIALPKHSFRRFLSAVLLHFVWIEALSAQVGAPGAQVAINDQAPLRELSLEQLGKIEVTTASKEPEALWKTPAAIFVITQDDINRSGATNIPEALRLAPGVELHASTATSGPSGSAALVAGLPAPSWC
jgi:outer membrane receptor for monomeric catechols